MSYGYSKGGFAPRDKLDFQQVVFRAIDQVVQSARLMDGFNVNTLAVRMYIMAVDNLVSTLAELTDNRNPNRYDEVFAKDCEACYGEEEEYTRARDLYVACIRAAGRNGLLREQYRHGKVGAD